MTTTFTLIMSPLELAQYTAELYRQGVQFTVFNKYKNEYTFTLTGY